MPVQVIHYNPRRRRPGLLGRVLPRVSLSNFGDMIGPLLVARIRDERALSEPSAHRRLLTVGSILHLAEPGDTVWGSGVNGKVNDPLRVSQLDVRSVRGPLTQEALTSKGIPAPSVFGDPALLWSRFWPRSSYTAGMPEEQFNDVTVIPNFHDFEGTKTSHNLVNPLADPHAVIEQIARSRLVCGSSLHAIILADSLGVPARLIRSAHEAEFKYRDHYAGTGRPEFQTAASVDEAIEMGGENAPQFDAEELISAFPADLWKQTGVDRS
ncbi:polysaccharide pyruvyl transferase family protein [Microbacterium sp. F51-2R]|uniref:polysaccharide pyruvyl transferase family protein n=1 Tax=Microbacterium sp. F51-2R TaxID=3445777 RepID=UPI003FA0F7BB